MPVDYKKNKVVFSDEVAVDDAEKLLEWIQKNTSAKADLAACTHIHPANIQVLMAAGIQVCAWPQDTNLRAWLESALLIGKGSSNG